jgi:hypothetical protein
VEVEYSDGRIAQEALHFVVVHSSQLAQQPTGFHRRFRAVGPYVHIVAQDDPRWHLV